MANSEKLARLAELKVELENVIVKREQLKNRYVYAAERLGINVPHDMIVKLQEKAIDRHRDEYYGLWADEDELRRDIWELEHSVDDNDWDYFFGMVIR